MNRHFEASYIGRLEYQKAVALQENLFWLAKEKNLQSVIGLEHPAVMTLGHRSAEWNYGQLEMPVVRSSRGGLITIHSEGQLVIYPILDLRALNWGVKHYVTILLRTTKTLLKEFNIESQCDEKSVGLYTDAGKIAFCGIQIKNGISLHGISLNVRNDLSLFRAVDACGVSNADLDRMQNYNVNLTLDEIFQRWVQIFKSELH